MKTTVFWDVTPCRLIDWYQHFRGTYSIPVSLHHILEDSNLHKSANIQNIIIVYVNLQLYNRYLNYICLRVKTPVGNTSDSAVTYLFPFYKNVNEAIYLEGKIIIPFLDLMHM
jgi:hypothetical protein